MRGWLRAKKASDSATPGQVPEESLDEDSEDDLETVPRRSPLNPAASGRGVPGVPL